MNSKMTFITPEEMTWTQAQPVLGTPSLTRLRASLDAAGLRPAELVLAADRTSVEFRLVRGPASRHMEREQTLRNLITTVRRVLRLGSLNLTSTYSTIRR